MDMRVFEYFLAAAREESITRAAALLHISNFATYNLLHNAAALVLEGAGPAVCLDFNLTYPGLVFVPFDPSIEMGAVQAWKGLASMPAGAWSALLRRDEPEMAFAIVCIQ